MLDMTLTNQTLEQELETLEKRVARLRELEARRRDCGVGDDKPGLYDREIAPRLETAKQRLAHLRDAAPDAASDVSDGVSRSLRELRSALDDALETLSG